MRGAIWKQMSILDMLMEMNCNIAQLLNARIIANAQIICYAKSTRRMETRKIRKRWIQTMRELRDAFMVLPSNIYTADDARFKQTQTS